MRKKTAVSGLAQKRSCCAVHVSRSNAGTDRFARGLLRLAQRLIHVTLSCRRFPEVHGARHVRTIASEYNTEVQHYESVTRNPLRRGASMRQRRARTGGDDSFK